MEALKKIKWDMIATSVMCTALGIILVIFPEAVNEMITYVLAAGMFVISILEFYNYFRQSAENTIYGNSLVFAVTTLILGIIVLAKRYLIISLIPLFLGILILVSGVKKLQNSFDMLRLKISGWLTVMILAAINIVFGTVMVVYSFESATVITILIGAGLIYSGLTDLFSTLWVSSCAKKCMKEAASVDYDDTKPVE